MARKQEEKARKLAVKNLGREITGVKLDAGESWTEGGSTNQGGAAAERKGPNGPKRKNRGRSPT